MIVWWRVLYSSGMLIIIHIIIITTSTAWQQEPPPYSGGLEVARAILSNVHFRPPQGMHSVVYTLQFGFADLILSRFVKSIFWIWHFAIWICTSDTFQMSKFNILDSDFRLWISDLILSRFGVLIFDLLIWYFWICIFNISNFKFAYLTLSVYMKIQLFGFVFGTLDIRFNTF